MKRIIIGFHEGEGTGNELIPGAYSVTEILKKKYPEIDLVKIPFLYKGYSKFDLNSKKIFDKIKRDHGSVISGAISGDNTYDLRSKYQFSYKLVEVKPFDSLANFSPLKPELRKRIDWLLIRHNKGIFTIAKEKWIFKDKKAEWTTVYDLEELKDMARVSFEYAQKRKKKLTLTVKSKQQSKVIDIWKKAFTEVGKNYPDVELTILNPDFAGADAFEHPEKYDVFFMPDIIGDTLADIYVMLLNGNRNFDGSANFSVDGFSYYNTLHGAAKDKENKSIVNPSGTISNLALMFKYSFNREDIYFIIKNCLDKTLKKYCTEDFISKGKVCLGTKEFFNKYIENLREVLKE